MKKRSLGLVLACVVVAVAAVTAYAQAVQPAIQTSTPKSEKQVTNIDACASS